MIATEAIEKLREALGDILAHIAAGTNESVSEMIARDCLAATATIEAPTSEAVAKGGRRKILMPWGMIDVTPAAQPAADHACPKETPYGPATCGACVEADDPAPTDAGIPITDEMVAFEAWAEAHQFDIRRPHRDYINTCTDYAWNGWQARGQQQAGVPEGCVVVPKEPTEAPITVA